MIENKPGPTAGQDARDSTSETTAAHLPVRHHTARARALLFVTLAGLVIAAIVIGLRGLQGPSTEISVSETNDQPVATLPATSEPDSPHLLESTPATRSAIAPASDPPRRPRPVPRETEPEGPVGIHAFPPLGTNPVLAGIIVPDDFELPPGYVRHYQTSDEGQMLDPILMYHPTRPPLDEHGQPLPIPADRVVPPELVPEGLPINILEPPETREDEPISLRRVLGSN